MNRWAKLLLDYWSKLCFAVKNEVNVMDWDVMEKKMLKKEVNFLLTSLNM